MPATINHLLDAFLSWKEQTVEPSTVAIYKQRLARFRERFGSRPFCELSSIEILQYLADVNKWPDGRAKAPDTQRLNVLAVDQVQKFALEHKELTAPIVERFVKPSGRLRDKIPTPEQTAALLAVASTEFRIIYRSLRLTGARPGELCRARIEDIDREERLIVLKHHKTIKKSGRPRRIAIGEKFAELLEESINGRTSGPIFLRKCGRAWTPEQLSQTYSRYRRQAGLPDWMVLYLARHEHATQLCSKLDIHAASVALGHSNLQTTQRYVKVSAAVLRRNQDVFEE